MHQLQRLLVLNGAKGRFKAEGNTLWLYEAIVANDDDAAVFGGVSPASFIEALRAMSGTVHVRINCPGGDAFGATAMAQAMVEYPGQIVTHVDGIAASAASLIATTGDETIMAPGSLMMIHNAWTLTAGDRHQFRKTAEVLKKVDAQLARSYALKAGRDAEHYAELMDAETWFTAEEAVNEGLADGLAERQKASANAATAGAWNLSAYKHPPKVAVPVQPMRASSRAQKRLALAPLNLTH